MRKRIFASVCAASLAAACGGSADDQGSRRTAEPPSGGLDMRPANATCVAPEPSVDTSVALVRAFPNLSFAQPVAMLQAPGDDSRWFVLEKAGRVRVFRNDAAVEVTEADFIDLRGVVDDGGEGGLLGMAFAPDFSTSRHAYLSWTTQGAPMVSIVARFTSLDDGLTLDPGSRQDILALDQDSAYHNGGQIAFGSDGYLYIGFGDGGLGDRAQDTTNLLGSFLRLDVDAGVPYAIPGGATGNPFAGNALCPADHSSATACPEIFAWGLRNPWRWSFDRVTGELWAGDVGQSTFEEIDRIERGGNYGWNCREGGQEYADSAPSCAMATALVDPVYFYGRSAGDVSVTGGYVYRGSSIPGLAGDYVFGDFGSGRIWRLLEDGGGTEVAEELLDSGLSIASFAEGNDGELYVVDLGGGLYGIRPGGSSGTPTVASVLSATGCFDAADPSRPVPGLIPYDVTAPYWSDGAAKERWLAIPDGATIGVGADGHFSFPPGAVLAQHFRFGGELIETRLSMRQAAGDWAGYTYRWNAEQTEAYLLEQGSTATIGSIEWRFPGSAECSRCHTSAAGFSLGLEVAQLNGELHYPRTGRTANQLSSLAEIGMFAAPIGEPDTLARLVDPADPGAALDARARAYLHTNCAHCHRPGGPAPGSMDLRASVGFAAMGVCGVIPQAGDLGIADALLMAPGEPSRSVLLQRMERRDEEAMPPLGSSLVDPEGAALIGEWISSLAAC